MSLICTNCKYTNPQDFADEDRHYWEAQTGEDQLEESWKNMEHRVYIRAIPCPCGHEDKTMLFMGKEW